MSMARSMRGSEENCQPANFSGPVKPGPARGYVLSNWVVGVWSPESLGYLDYDPVCSTESPGRF